MNHKLGNFLIEFMCYLGLLLFILSISFLWVTHVYVPIVKKSSAITATASFFSGASPLYYDIFSAPCALSNWKKITDSEIIWSCGTIDRGWKFQNNQLKRTEGTYDITSNRWHQATTGLAISALHLVSFTLYQNNDRVCGVEVTYIFDENRYTQLIAIRNNT